MRSALIAAGFQPSNYIGSDGLYGRADLAGLNFAEFPAVLVELGNMRNADEAVQMQSPDGRARYAAAVTQGIIAYLTAKAPPYPWRLLSCCATSSAKLRRELRPSDWHAPRGQRRCSCRGSPMCFRPCQ